MSRYTKRLVIHENYNIKGLNDFNFKYDEEKNLYKHGGLVCNEKTRELSCSTKARAEKLYMCSIYPRRASNYLYRKIKLLDTKMYRFVGDLGRKIIYANKFVSEIIIFL